jgi:ribosomal protein S18 acetylase RimI-like enzyme
MTGITVRGIDSQDIPELSKVLALAFDSDPVFSWAVRQDQKRTDALRSLFTYLMEDSLRYGEERTTSDLKGCAIWLPPEEAKEPEQLLSTLRVLPRLIRYSSLSRIHRLLNLITACDEKRPKTPHFYLDFIAVHPDKQGQGYASLLLSNTLSRLDATLTPAYLESSNPCNNPLYMRFGFKVTDEIHLPGGPTLWCMWREPRAPNNSISR